MIMCLLTSFRRGQFPSMDTTHNQQFALLVVLVVVAITTAGNTTRTAIVEIRLLVSDYQCTKALT